MVAISDKTIINVARFIYVTVQGEEISLNLAGAYFDVQHCCNNVIELIWIEAMTFIKYTAAGYCTEL